MMGASVSHAIPFMRLVSHSTLQYLLSLQPETTCNPQSTMYLLTLLVKRAAYRVPMTYVHHA